MAYDYPVLVDMGPPYSGQASSISAVLKDSSDTTLLTISGFTEVGAGSGVYLSWQALQDSWSGVITYTWTGTPAIASWQLPPDRIVPPAAAGGGGGGTAPTVTEIHDALFASTGTKLAIDGSGRVVAASVAAPVTLPAGVAQTTDIPTATANGAAAATAILVTPANKLATNASGQVPASNLPTDYQQRTAAVILPAGVAQTSDVTAATATILGGISAQVVPSTSDIAAALFVNGTHKLNVDASGNVAANNIRLDYQRNNLPVVLPTGVAMTSDIPTDYQRSGVAVVLPAGVAQTSDVTSASSTLLAAINNIPAAASPPTTSQIASAILANPTHKVVTDASGFVTANINQDAISVEATWDGVSAMQIKHAFTAMVAAYWGSESIVNGVYTRNAPVSGTTLVRFDLSPLVGDAARTPMQGG